MSLFGSREEDPLLQDDPLAPTDEEASPRDDAKEDSPNDEDSSGDVPTNGASPEGYSTEAPEDGPHPATAHEEREDSVFRGTATAQANSESSHFRFEGGEDTRVIVRSAEEAVEGRLTVLNAAFDEGWDLQRVEVQDESSPGARAKGEEVSSQEGALMLAFVLHRSEPE